MNVAWYVHPPTLAEADYSPIGWFLERFLVSPCSTEAIYVHWIGEEQLKHCSISGNLSCIRYLVILFNIYDKVKTLQRVALSCDLTGD